jgi:hypothetical protein
LTCGIPNPASQDYRKEGGWIAPRFQVKLKGPEALLVCAGSVLGLCTLGGACVSAVYYGTHLSLGLGTKE